MYGKAKPGGGSQGFMINGEDIHQLLDKGVQFPQLLADDILAWNSIDDSDCAVNPKEIKKGSMLKYSKARTTTEHINW